MSESESLNSAAKQSIRVSKESLHRGVWFCDGTAECQEHCLNTAFLCDQNHNENNHNEDLEQTRRRRLYSETMNKEHQFRTSGTTEARYHVNSHEVKSDFFSSQWMPSSNLYEKGGDRGEDTERMIHGDR
ncbi:unnamed protein product [Gongylonema pulchrum]|uniref:Uncharacterized protein n=1 Tax=Gongylonema pulchrum TaxID=637853 RepID=A0A3P7N805_9BILA|nr:unnamed protein product [Gongylonema pulchrum]